jgi:hypothetical protein
MGPFAAENDQERVRKWLRWFAYEALGTPITCDACEGCAKPRRRWALFVRRLLLFGRKALLRGDKFKDLRRRHGEAVGELEKAVERNGLLGALYSADLIAVKVTHLRKLLLGEMPFNP